MNLEQVRDRIAELLGWKYTAMCEGDPCWYRTTPDEGPTSYEHPCPVTIDGIAKLMPDRWCQTIEQYETGWTAVAVSWDCTKNTGVIESQTELEARTRLLLAVLEKDNSISIRACKLCGLHMEADTAWITTDTNRPSPPAGGVAGAGTRNARISPAR